MSVPRLRLDLRCRCLVAEGDLDFDLTSRNWRSKNGVDQRNVSFGRWRLTTLHSPPAPIWLTFWLAIRDGLKLIFVDHVAISRDFLIMLRFHEIFLFIKIFLFLFCFAQYWFYFSVYNGLCRISFSFCLSAYIIWVLFFSFFFDQKF